MNRQDAIGLIRETFENPFDEARFTRFVRELLNDLQTGPEAQFSYAGQYIRQAYRDYVHRYDRLGKYTDPAGYRLDVLVVYLKKTSSLERARTMQRNFVADYLRKRDAKDAALVAYVVAGEPNWRFSFVRMDYQRQIDETSGKVKIAEKLTPARRFSFLVGAEEPNHTAQQQLLPVLQDEAHNPALDQLEEAFSIEKVSNAFFDDYKARFLELVEELERLRAQDPAVAREFDARGLDTVQFAKKLLGQIVFLYFLQKKGWLGVERGRPWGSGPKNFLSALFHQGGYDNFFDEVLEPLFYEALAIQRPDNGYPRLGCKIPFLNGGLFEPLGGYDWRGVPVLVDNAVFAKIFATFDLYNFTVREDEPLEKEVAVDPEMLGKVFERLLDVRDRKSKGAFYTPREIVHYMCQESLIHYLETAVGQAVPHADLETLIRKGELILQHEAAREAGVKSYPALMPASVRDHAAELDAALAGVKVCDPAVGSGAFPVGMMHEIVRARLALTPYLPSPGGEGDGDEGSRTPYAFKRHAIQESLYGVDLDPAAVDIAKLRLWLSLVVDEENYEEIKPLPNLDYKIVAGNSLLGVEKNLFNHHLFADLEARKQAYFAATDPAEKNRLRAEIDALIAQLTAGKTQFDFEIYFSEVFREKGGFDVVIGNPPYGAKIEKSIRRTFADKYRISMPATDSFVLFMLRTYDLLQKEGIRAFILPSSWLYMPTYSKLRKEILKYKLVRILLFREPVFESVVESCIEFSKKSRFSRNKISFKEITRSSPSLIETSTYLEQEKIAQIEDPNLVPLANPIEQELFFRLDASFPKLGSCATIVCGLTPYRKGKGNPPQDSEIVTKRAYDARYKVDETYRQYIIGRDFHRYVWQIRDERWIKYGDWLAEPRYTAPFDDEVKIVIRQTADSIIAHIDKRKYLSLKNVHNLRITNSNLEPNYLLGLLNSKLISWWYQKLIPEQNRVFAEVKVVNLKKLPIAIASSDEQKPIIDLVDRILASKAADPSADTSALEAEIDRLVYQLYGLTEAEIALVEESVGR